MKPSASPFSAGLRCRCPRCGRGKLFQGLLSVAPVCAVCGLNLKNEDSGDGPAVFVGFVISVLVIGLAIVLELLFHPPFWVHYLIWPPVVIGGSIWLLRPFKATMIALQYRHRQL